MDFLDDIFSESQSVKGRVTSRFKPKAKARPNNGPTKAAHSTVTNTTEEQPAASDSSLSVQPDVLVKEKSEAPTNSSLAKPKDIVGVSTTTAECPGNQSISETLVLDVSSIQNEKEIPGSRDVSFASSSPLRPCTSQATHDYFIPSTHEDSGDFQINVEQLEAGDFSCLDAVEMMNEAGSASGKRTSKLKPKPKAHDRAKDMVETLSNLSNAPQLSSDNQPEIDGSMHVGGPNSSLDGSFPTSATTDQSQNAVFEDTESLMDSDILEQRGEHGKIDGLNSHVNPLDEGPVLSGVEANENTYEFVNGTSDEFQVNSESCTNAHDELASNREENVNDGNLETEKTKKKRGRKPKNAVSENDKPSRKRKKVSQEPDKSIDKPSRKSKRVSKEPDKSIDKPPKKFPHATRRKRRVNPELLQVPEEDLDLHNLPIKDLILLAEHKEREAKKQAALVQPVPTTERSDNLLSEGFPYDDDALEFDQDRDLSEMPSTSGIQTDTGYYNYHTHRTIQPRAKWSKKDTEMFYQGIQQFGTDLSMIQQLFPGRSLEQIRSKYRKEQKQNPMMMHDAQTTRATDNSCFELVIKTLEAARAAQEKEYASSDDDLAHPTGKEGKPAENIESNATTAQEAAKSEHNLKDKGSEEPDRTEVASPVKSYNDDDDDDDDDWGNYTGL